MSKSGILVVLSGLSGVGKGTIVKRLMEKYPGEYVLSISATTREPRDGERDGREYFFKTEEEFRQMVENGEMLEHADYVSHSYGTPRKWVEEHLNRRKNVILEIETVGARQVKSLMPEAVLVFVKAPSMEELERRIRGRGTETDEVIEMRLAKADEELKTAAEYDYVITNEVVEKSVELLHNIISANREVNLGGRNMLHPSYTDLMNSVNSGQGEGEQAVVQSRYSIVMAASKRARQIVDGDEPLVEYDAASKPLSLAVDELYLGKVKITAEEQK